MKEKWLAIVSSEGIIYSKKMADILNKIPNVLYKKGKIVEQ